MLGTHVRVNYHLSPVNSFRGCMSVSAQEKSHLAWRPRVSGWAERDNRQLREKQFPGSDQKESGPGIRIRTSTNLGWQLPHQVVAIVTSDPHLKWWSLGSPEHLNRGAGA